MLKLKKNVLVIVLVMLAILLVITPASAYATIITPGGSTSATPSPAPVTTPSPTTTTTPTPKVTPTPITQTNLPKTGIEDYTGLIVVTIVLGGSAIFAYKKIKEYNKF